LGEKREALPMSNTVENMACASEMERADFIKHIQSAIAEVSVKARRLGRENGVLVADNARLSTLAEMAIGEKVALEERIAAAEAKAVHIEKLNTELRCMVNDAAMKMAALEDSGPIAAAMISEFEKDKARRVTEMEKIQASLRRVQTTPIGKAPPCGVVVAGIDFIIAEQAVREMIGEKDAIVVRLRDYEMAMAELEKRMEIVKKEKGALERDIVNSNAKIGILEEEVRRSQDGAAKEREIARLREDVADLIRKYNLLVREHREELWKKDDAAYRMEEDLKAKMERMKEDFSEQRVALRDEVDGKNWRIGDLLDTKAKLESEVARLRAKKGGTIGTGWT
jgi:chromosome segregation ATPase